MKLFRKIINCVLGGAVGLLMGFVLYHILIAFFGSAWSVAEGGPWIVVYSPYIILTIVGAVVSWFGRFLRVIVSCLITLLIFLVGGIILMFVAGMFVGGGAIVVVAIIGLLAGFGAVLSAIVNN